jgi:ABC-type sugar transport system substrate-binding protein
MVFHKGEEREMRRTAQPLAAVVGLIAVAAIAVGCGASERTSGDEGAQAASAAKEPSELTIGVSNLGQSFPFPASIGRGIKAEASKMGVELIELDAKGKPAKQANDMQDLITRKPDGILLLPVDSGVAQGLVNQSAEASIPVVAVASQVGDPKERELTDVYPKLVALATQDEIGAGEKAAEIVTKLLPEGGKIAVVEGQAGFAEVALRLDGFKEVLEGSGQQYDIVASQPGDWLPDKSEDACQNMLASNPEIELFYAEADDMAVGCAEAVKAANSDVKIVGVGGSKLVINAIKDGSVAGTVCYKPEDLGALALQTIVNHLTGEQRVDAEFVSYDTPAITKDNVADCDPQW